MTALADIRTLAEYAPLAFLLGVLIGLWLASFYRIVKRRNHNRGDDP